MKRKNILVVGTSPRDLRELSINTITGNTQIHFQQYDSHKVDKLLCINPEGESEAYSPAAEIDLMLEYCRTNAIEAVVSTEDYPGSIFSSIIAQHLGLPGPTPQSVLTCQHKYYSRVTQQKFVPSATPGFMLIDPKNINQSSLEMSFPLFVKPVKSYFSIFANQVTDYDEFVRVVQTSLPSKAYLEPLNWFLENYSSYELNADYLLAERLLQGEQVTVEGYVFDGNVEIMGVVDSIMYPGTICFERFDYPSCLPITVQDRMALIAKQYIKGIGLDYSLFNIEMMYNPATDEIHIIEVNPRMSSQFADLFEKVDGVNTYQILLDIALGIKPSFLRRKGKHKTSASFVLRRFENNQVIKSPTKDEIRHVSEELPDSRIEIFAIQGQDLSAFKQDGKSFRYGLIHLGAQNKDELFYQFELCKQKLSIAFLQT